MPRASPGVLSFNAGEWSPRLRGRVDHSKYASSCRTLENFIPTIQGAATKRPGTTFVNETPAESPAYSAHGTFALTTGVIGTTQSVALNFDPTVLILWVSDRTEASDTLNVSRHVGSFGFAAGSKQGCTAWVGQDAVATTNTGSTLREDSAICILNAAGTVNVAGQAAITSLAGGFTLRVDKAFSGAYVVHYWAFRVPKAHILSYTSPATATTDTVGPFPFTPDTAIVLGTGALDAVSAHYRPSFGVCTGGGTSQYGVTIYSDDAVGTTDTARYAQTGECFLEMLSAAGPRERGSITSMAANLINVSFAEVVGSGIPYIVLAIDSDGAMESFDFATLTSTGVDIDVTGMAAKPVGGLVFSHGTAESAADTADVDAVLSIGGFSSAASQSGLAWLDDDAATTSSVAERIDYDAVYQRLSPTAPPTLVGSAQVTAINSDGFTLQMDDADPDAAFCFGIALTGSDRTNATVRCVPFLFNSTDAHELEFGHKYMRVYTDGGIQLEAAVAITASTQANPVRVTAAGHGLQNGDGLFITGVVGMTELNGRYYVADNVSSGAFDLLGVDGTGYTAYTSGGTVQRVFSISTPYDAIDLSGLSWFQSADVLYLAHESYPPQKLSRTGNAAWTIEAIDFDWPPFQPENLDEDEYIVANTISGSVTLTSTGGRFLAGHVGGFLKMRSRFQSNAWEWAATSGASALQDVNVGEFVWYEDNMYELINKFLHGQTGTSPPVHEIGTRTDGHWSWKWRNNGSGYIRIDSIETAYRATGTVVAEIPEACADPDIAITSISSATPPVVTTAAPHSYETGDRVWIQGMSGAASVFNNAYYTITDTGASTFSLDDQVASGTATGGEAVRVRTGDLQDVEQYRDHDLWSFGAFSAQNGYPRAVTLFEDRLYWAGTTADPYTAWASRTGEYEDHKPSGSSDLGALTIVLATGDPIEWMIQQNALLFGLSGSEFGSIRDGDPMAPDTIHQIRKKSSYGSRRSVRPAEIENQVLIAQRSGRELREIRFDIDSGDFSGANLALLAEHLTLGTIQELAFQSQPDRILWVLLEDGTLRSMTYERSQEVVAWSPHVIGGTDVSVLSISVIPDPAGVRDELWMAVQRTINSQTKIYIERLNPLWTGEDAIEDAIYLDSALTYDGSPTSTVTGLEHLEGEAVAALADGLAVTGLTVSGGEVTLATAASTVQVGLAYNGDIETQQLEAGSATGVAAGKIQRIQDVVFRLEETGAGLQYGPDLTLLRDTLNMTAGVLSSGDFGPVPWPQGQERGSRIAIRHASPLPCMIVALFPRLATQD